MQYCNNIPLNIQYNVGYVCCAQQRNHYLNLKLVKTVDSVYTAQKFSNMLFKSVSPTGRCTS